MDASVVDVPELGALVLWVPLAGLIAEGVDALLGARLLLVAACAAEGGIEAIVTQTVEQGLGLEQTAAALGVERDGVGSSGDGALVAPHQQLGAHLAGHLVAEGNHFAEFEAGIHVQKRKGDGPGKECLLGQAKHDGGVFADGVKHHRPLELAGYFAKNMDALGLEHAQVADARRRERGIGGGR